MKSKWKRKADALARLAEDQRGTPEGDLAREKLAEILRKHPEAAEYEPIKDLAKRDLMGSDFIWMKQQGISVEGSWTGVDFEDALGRMEADYWERIEEHLRWSQVRIAAMFGVPPELLGVEVNESSDVSGTLQLPDGSEDEPSY